MTFENLQFRCAGGVAWIMLDRPAAANSLSIALAEEFCAAVDLANNNRDVHVVVLQGAGKFFCAGGDVAAMAEAEDPAEFLRILAGKMSEGLLALTRSRLVTIAAVHGAAAGAGLALVLNSDLVLASSNASFQSAYAKVGLTPDCGVSYLLPQVVGPRRAAEICLSGRVVTAPEALQWGLVNEVVDESALQLRAEDLALRLAGSAAQTLGPTKRLLTRAAVAAYGKHLDDEVATISTIVSHENTRNRIISFAGRSKAGGRS
ncbi:enoyl-CoA hydratase/isomerase family protein [Arthrobacter globiformis]|uniref:enoyl-CoA hydratase/isomerase family protein n=1 Tax=Arthrobacter globiformis TaxID=1665 RepID=UPI00279446B0|nr:enoyl-CoA hydratase/isomerase family protein [Arthrobacter globiformis]MDQ0618174.1 2-(1,2-epoxy-1,2-dihydrophenyl)acetyl-CoA isomerase [Arthrobacter globiformis]